MDGLIRNCIPRKISASTNEPRRVSRGDRFNPDAALYSTETAPRNPTNMTNVNRIVTTIVVRSWARLAISLTRQSHG